MRDNFNFNMLPIVEDNMNHIAGVRSYTSLPSNGYYGYQPPMMEKHKEEELPEPHLMEVQFERTNRKRTWDFGNEFRDFKKRRQNECIPFGCQQFSGMPSKDAKSRKPTHNLPDMPRCIMGHYI